MTTTAELLHALRALDAPRRHSSPLQTGSFSRECEDYGWEVDFDYEWSIESREDAPNVNITGATLRAEPDKYPLKLSAFTDKDLRMVEDEIVAKLESELHRAAAEDYCPVDGDRKAIARAANAYARTDRDWPL